MLLTEIAQSFDKNNINYVILGGYAVALHGVVRGTVAVDLAVGLDSKSFQKAEEALGHLGLQSRLPLKASEVFQFRKEYSEKRNLIAWSFYDPTNPMRQVDILIMIDAHKIQKIIKKIQGIKVSIASVKDLIRLKEAAGRPQDLEDARALRELHNEK